MLLIDCRCFRFIVIYGQSNDGPGDNGKSPDSSSANPGSSLKPHRQARPERPELAYSVKAQIQFKAVGLFVADKPFIAVKRDCSQIVAVG